MEDRKYYCLHDCIINKIECKQGSIKTLEDWKKHLNDYPHKVVEWNRFFFHEMKDDSDIPLKWWNNGSMKKESYNTITINNINEV